MNASSTAITPSNLLSRDADDDLQCYTPAEAAGFLGTTVGTLAQMRFHGEGPEFVLLNTSIRYRRKILLEYLKSRSGLPPQDVPRRKAGPGRPRGKKRRATKAA